MKNTRARTVARTLLPVTLLGATLAGAQTATPELTNMVATGEANMDAIAGALGGLVVALLGVAWLIFGGKKVKPQGK